MSRVNLVCFLLLLSATAQGQAGAPAAAQSAASQEESTTPVTTLKVATRLVAISAVVKSKEGEPQANLAKDDFVLKQDGKEVPIRYFSRGSEVPLSFALMVDTSGSQQTFVGDETLASDVFFDSMLGRKEDRATLVEFNSTVLQLKAMTNSANALHLALSHLRAPTSMAGGTLLYDGIYVVSKSILAKESGRKAIVMLSDGGDNGSRHTLAEAIEQAQRADVQVYAIQYSLFGSLTGGSTGQAPAADPGLGALQKLSDSTGGRVFTVSHKMGLRDVFAQISQDLRLQYELAYTPPPATQPDSYHKLELRVRDKKLGVQARKGFFESP